MASLEILALDPSWRIRTRPRGLSLVLMDNIAVASKDAALRATQEAADDPHVLSREENNAIAMNVMARFAGGSSSGVQRRELDDDDDS
ncbi:uncharacterized protein A4U43_C04F18550 [Asparagus officinalis]|uniref:Uncharacterized protein n=1 Tax=Asparagus officinalis TaxID=4686 RepID=A0A5P1F2G4_ASPOF|nr:uncharacterized protein A4U43_C04F18550 [Asparagus officinalis]